jgi:hypothetical protein
MYCPNELMRVFGRTLCYSKRCAAWEKKPAAEPLGSILVQGLIQSVIHITPIFCPSRPGRSVSGRQGS